MIYEIKLIIGIVLFVEFALPENVGSDGNELGPDGDVRGVNLDVDGCVVSVLDAERFVGEAVAIRDVAAVRREELAHVICHWTEIMGH